MNPIQAEKLIKLAPDIMYVLDSEGRFVFIGGACKRLIGYSAKELMGRHFTDVVWPEDVEKTQWHFNERRTGRRATRRHRVRLVTRKGKRLDFDVCYRIVQLDACGMWDKPCSAGDKRFLGTHGVARDITSYIRLQETLMSLYKRASDELRERKVLSRILVYLIDREHDRIAGELHDNIGQTLVGLKLDLEIVRDRYRAPMGESLCWIEKAIEKSMIALKDLRIVAYGLMPAALKVQDLVTGLQHIIREVAGQTGTKTYFFHHDVPPKIKRMKKLALFRIAQEALTNVSRHAKAGKVYVNLVKKDKALSLTVEDDGVGFDVTVKRKSDQPPLGLLMMEERTRQLGGEFVIESSPGRGTYLLAKIPL